MATADHARIPRFPAGEHQWDAVSGEHLSTYVVESQFSSPERTDWSLSRVALVLNRSPDPLVTEQIPFGVGKQPHRWRIWAISTTGELSISEWRLIHFTN